MIPHITAECEHALVNVDPYVMNRIINNLLANAIKYGNGFIRVHIASKEMIEMTFENGLENISLEVGHLLEKYDTGGRQGKDATGIGLYIVTEFINRLGGEITVRKEGTVLCIQVKLPKAIV